MANTTTRTTSGDLTGEAMQQGQASVMEEQGPKPQGGLSVPVPRKRRGEPPKPQGGLGTGGVPRRHGKSLKRRRTAR